MVKIFYLNSADSLKITFSVCQRELFIFLNFATVICSFCFILIKELKFPIRRPKKERGRFLVESVKVMCYKLKTVVER